MSESKNRKLFIEGMKHGLPIGAAYFAVSFSLGIAAANAGVNATQGFFMSLLNNASAGEYAAIEAIRSNATYLELILLIIVANARYLLMGCSVSQKLAPDMPLRERMIISFDVTDEIFGLIVAFPGFVVPVYLYGVYLTTMPFWAIGTSLGIIAGNILPAKVVMALSAAIYGMFIAIVVPPVRKNRFIGVLIVISFVSSSLWSIIPVINQLSESLRIILLTIIISCAAAYFKPIRQEDSHNA